MQIDLSKREILLIVEALDMAYEEACVNADEGEAERVDELRTDLMEKIENA